MGIMVGTFIGPGGIYMMISGAVEVVFGWDPMTSLLINLVPLVLFMLSCYYTDSKVQLAFAKLLTLIYSMVMMAVYVGIIIQMNDEGTILHNTHMFKWRSPS